MILILLVLALSIAVLLAMIGMRCGGRTIPMPPKHLKPKRKNAVLRMRNPPPPPLVSADSMKLIIDNADKAQKAYNKMKNKLDFKNWVEESYGKTTLEKVENTDIETFSLGFLESMNSKSEPKKAFVYFLLDEIEKKQNKNFDFPAKMK